MSKPRDERHKDLFRPALDEIVDPGHPLVRLVQEIDCSRRAFQLGVPVGPGGSRRYRRGWWLVC